LTSASTVIASRNSALAFIAILALSSLVRQARKALRLLRAVQPSLWSLSPRPLFHFNP
jgi:hypothetical protein